MSNSDEPYDNLSLTAFFSKFITKRVKNFVQEFEPDIIIRTHSYAGVVMSIMRQKGYINCPVVGIVTDFTVHPFWESTELDKYVIPDSLLTYQMNKKGIQTNKLLPIGIPVREQFSKKISKTQAREMLGIDKDKETVLVMMGSMGYGNMLENLMEINDFDADFQVIVVCGTNEKARKAINKTMWDKKVYCYGFVDNVDVIMDAADVIISKPGGLTTSESLAKGLPMIAMNPLPGQEEKNVTFLTNNGAAVSVNEDFSISEALYQIFYEKWRIELMREAILHIGKPDSTHRLYEEILKMCNVKEEIGI